MSRFQYWHILAITTIVLVGSYLALSRPALKPPVSAPEGTQEAVPAPEPPPVPPEPSAAPEPVQKLLFQFETKFKAGPKYEGRVTNIKKLARMLDNIHLFPGEEFRFNKIVGPRTLDKGFKKAPTYFLGEIIPGVGGGVCQISSTLYAAALHVGVEVTDRRPHSRVSSYIPAGLDATVNYPPDCWDAKKPDKRICFDLKFKNPYDFDLIFRFEIGAEIEKKKPEDENGKQALIISVFGTGTIPTVTTKWMAFGNPPFKKRFRKVSWWKDGRKKLKQSGKPGLRGARLVTTEWSDGRVTKKRVYSKYSPTPEVWHVGLAFEKPPEEPKEDPIE